MTREEIKILKSIYTAPLGSFPKGGIESSFKVKVISHPNKITLKNKHFSNTIYKEDDEYIILIERNNLSERKTTDNFQEAIFLLLEPFIKQEIKNRCV